MTREYKIGERIRDRRYAYWRDFHFDRSLDESPFSLGIKSVNPTYHPFNIEDLVAVHLTDQEVKDGFLKPHSYSPFTHYQEKTLSSPKKVTKWFFPRETLHFTLNGVVADHRGGIVSGHYPGGNLEGPKYSWTKKRFAYLIPLKEIIPQVVSLFTHNTIVLGKVRLSPRCKVIDRQTSDKVLKTITKRGYTPFLMQGVKALDPAFLMTESIGININHPLNFSSILDDLSISGAYYEPSVDNIDCLDDILRCILKDAMRWDPLPFSYKKAVKELEERRDYFRERFKGDKSKKIGLSRLQKGVQVYINYLKEYIETEFYELGKFRNREEEKALSMIRWEDNLHFSV